MKNNEKIEKNEKNERNEKNEKTRDNTNNNLVIIGQPKLSLNNLPKDEVFKVKSTNKFKNFISSFYKNKIKGKLSSKKKYIFKYCKKDDILMTAIVLISMIFYYISLAKCDDDPSECTIKRGMKFYFMIGIFAAISAVLYSIFITLSIYCMKYFINYIYSIPFYIYFFVSDTGTNTIHHGFYNAFGWWVISLVFIPVLLFILYI